MASPKPYQSPRKMPLGEARIIQGTIYIRSIQGVGITSKKGKVHAEVWVGEKKIDGPLYFKSEAVKAEQHADLLNLNIAFDLQGHARLKIRFYRDKTTFLGKVNINLLNLKLDRNESDLIYDLVNSKKPKNAKCVIQGRAKVKVAFDPKPWQVLKKMGRRRAGHTATLLEDGSVIVCGGVDMKDNDATNSCEIWNPKTYEFDDRMVFMMKMRAYHTATMLKDGKILVCGGYSEYGADRESHTHAEVYDPKTKQFTAVSAMKHGRYRHSAALMGDGRVLVAGGVTRDTPTAKVEIYDPKADTWKDVSPCQQGMFGHTLTTLPSGDVVMIGGSATKSSSNALESSYIFYHNLETWGPGPIFPISMVRHSAQVLKHPASGGKIIVTPGSDWYTSWTTNKNAKFNSEAFVTDPTTKKFSRMGRARTSCGVVAVLKDDYVVALGGETQRKGLVPDCSFVNAKAHMATPDYDIHWDELEPCILTRYEPVGVLLQDQYQVLLIGGISADDRTKALPYVELFDFRGTEAFKVIHEVTMTPSTAAGDKDKKDKKEKGKDKDSKGKDKGKDKDEKKKKK